MHEGPPRRRRSWPVAVAVVCLAAAGLAIAEEADEQGSEVSSPSETQSDPFNRFLSNLSPDEPLYIVFGWRDGTNAKFQLSFKYRFLNPEGRLTEGVPFFSRIYFGYTQTSLWDLGEPSAPFFDTSYRPSLFYRHDQLMVWGEGRSRLWGQVGIEHASNGKGGDESRSLNTLYVQPVFEMDRAIGSAHLTVKPRLWLYVGDLSENPDIAEYRGYGRDLSENPDIAEYRGYGRLRLAVTGRAEWQVAATGQVGTSGKGSIQIDVTYPMDRILLRTFDAFLYAQYFNGWSESLLAYDQRMPWQLRIGLAVVR